MAGAYAGVCLMCGRTLGYAVAGRFFTSPGGVRPQRQGGHLRCGYCGGGVLFEADIEPTPAWVAKMRREEIANLPLRRAYRRRAV